MYRIPLIIISLNMLNCNSTQHSRHIPLWFRKTDSNFRLNCCISNILGLFQANVQSGLQQAEQLMALILPISDTVYDLLSGCSEISFGPSEIVVYMYRYIVIPYKELTNQTTEHLIQQHFVFIDASSNWNSYRDKVNIFKMLYKFK